jgi:hypothetical protein
MSLLLLFAGIGSTAEIDVAGAKRRRHPDEELTEAEVQFMQRKLAELKRAKTAAEEAAAAKALEVALAQAAQDDEAAEVITATIAEKRPEIKTDYGAIMRDVALLTDITRQLAKIARAAADERRRQEDEDDIEMLMLAL